MTALVLQQNRLRCYGHVLRKEDDDWVKKCMEYEVEGQYYRCKCRKMIKGVRWSGWVWVGECFFWYRPTRVVPYQRPLNGCVCCGNLWGVVCASRTHTRLCRQSPSGLSDGLCQRVTRVEIFKLTYAAELILAGIEFHDIFGSWGNVNQTCSVFVYGMGFEETAGQKKTEHTQPMTKDA